MTKRLVDIDDELLDAAREAAETATMKATVNEALKQLVEADLRRRHLRRLEAGDGTNLSDERTMDRAWR